MGEYKCLLIQPKDIHRIWRGVEPLIQRSLDTIQQSRGVKYLIPEDYKGWMEANLAQLFIVIKDKEIKVVTITQICPYPRFDVLEYLLLGGKELKNCYEILAARVEEFARIENCSHMRVSGRKGLKKLLKNWEEIKDKHSINLMKIL